MRISAILFALPAALLRKTRRTKRRSDCDKYSEDEKAVGKDRDLINGCLDLSDKCRVLVIPNPLTTEKTAKDADDHDYEHFVFCELIDDLDTKDEI